MKRRNQMIEKVNLKDKISTLKVLEDIETKRRGGQIKSLRGLLLK